MQNLMLEKYLNILKLKAVTEIYDDIVNGNKQKANFDNLMLQLLQHEINSRSERSISKKIKAAKFPNVKTLDNFDFDRVKDLDKESVTQLLSCNFIEKKENIIAIGSCGAGKTHIAISLGISACQKGYSVYFTSAVNLATELVEQRDKYTYMNFIKRLNKYDLLIVDELGYLTLSSTSSELLFNVFSERYESGSIMVTSNLDFGEWNKIFNNDKMTVALIDRLVHHSIVLRMEGESYRYSEKINSSLKK